MNSFTQGAGFRIAGSLVRKFVVSSGKVAFLTIDVYDSASGRSRKIDVKTFDGDVIDELRGLRDGSMLEVTGHLDMEKLTDKARAEVKVDGREKWVPSLIAKVLRTEASSRPSASKSWSQPQQEPAPADDDGPPPNRPEDVPY